MRDDMIEVMARGMAESPPGQSMAQAALSAIEEAGMVVVPAEPTGAMVEAFAKETGFDFDGSIADGYRAMLAAHVGEGV